MGESPNTPVDPNRRHILSEEDPQFWLNSSQSALDRVWDNTEDEVYAQLLET